jgi:hypothetical protein
MILIWGRATAEQGRDMRRINTVLMLLGLVVSLGACVVEETGPGPGPPGTHWVPGHHGAYGEWVPGHWVP